MVSVPRTFQGPLLGKLFRKPSMYWKKNCELTKKVRFAFRKLTKVGRSTEIVRLKVSTSDWPSGLSLSTNGRSFTQVISALQLDLLQSSAKSIEKPRVLVFSKFRAIGAPSCHWKSRRPKRTLPPAFRVLRCTRRLRAKLMKFLQNWGRA